MSFVRDRNSHTRGINAIAALDGVSSQGRAMAAAKARAMAHRDRQLALAALGALNIGGPTGARPGSGIRFDYGTSAEPTPPRSPGIGAGGTRPPTTVTTAPPPRYLNPNALTRPLEAQPVELTNPLKPPRPPPEPAPPPLPPFPAPVRPTSPSSPSGGGGGGGYSPHPSFDPIEPSPMPEPVDPPATSSKSPSATTLLLGAGALLGAYFLMKKA